MTRRPLRLLAYAGGLMLALFVTQVMTWATYGRHEFPLLLASAIREAGDVELVVHSASLETMPSASAESMLSRLNEGGRVWQEEEVPASYFEIVEPMTADGSARAYHGAEVLQVGTYRNNALSGEFVFGLSFGNLGGSTYKQTWVCVFGHWIPTSPLELVSIS